MDDDLDVDIVIARSSHLLSVEFDCIGHYFDTMLHVLPISGYGAPIVGLYLKPTGRSQGQYWRVD